MILTTTKTESSKPYCTRWTGIKPECPPQADHRVWINIDLLYPSDQYVHRWVCATCFKPSKHYYRALLKPCSECFSVFSRFDPTMTVCKKCSLSDARGRYVGWADVTRRLLADPLLKGVRDARTFNTDWRRNLPPGYKEHNYVR